MNKLKQLLTIGAITLSSAVSAQVSEDVLKNLGYQKVDDTECVMKYSALIDREEGPVQYMAEDESLVIDYLGNELVLVNSKDGANIYQYIYEQNGESWGKGELETAEKRELADEKTYYRINERFCQMLGEILGVRKG